VLDHVRYQDISITLRSSQDDSIKLTGQL